MKISCPSCTAKYSIADDKVQNRLAKIRCRKCGTTIVIDGKSDPPVVRAADSGGTDDDGAASTAQGFASIAPGAMQPGAPRAGQGPASAGSGTLYTVDVADNDQRSMTVEQIVAAYNDGTIAADTYVWREGMGDWEPLADVDELNRALHAAASGASVTSAAASSAVHSSAGSAAATGRVSSAGMFGGSGEAARAATRGEVSKDLFGSIDMAGSEYDTRTSAAQEAAQAKAATGARNESSVLFSLSALTSGPEPAVRTAAPKNREDSGLIDLAALASLAATSASKESAGGMVLGDMGGSQANSPLAAPLGLPPLNIGAGASPLGGLEVPQATGGTRGAMYIGGGIAVAAIVAGLAYILKEDPPAVAVAPTPPAISAPAIPSSPEPEVAAAGGSEEGSKNGDKGSEGEGKSSPSKASGGGPAKARPASGGKRPVAASSPAQSKPAEPASGGEEKKPAAAPKKKCNCSPSDLMCAMRCSAK